MTTAKVTETKNLYAKLAEIMGLMAHIPKEGFNKAQQYKFVRETDVAAKASELLSERHIFIAQSVENSSLQELYRTQSGMTMWLTIVDMAFQFIDGESGERSDAVHFTGYGADTGDKGIYKAMTGAEKYFLMKTFLISTGDDPEADEKVDKQAAAGAAARGGPRVQRSAQPGVQRGGKADGTTNAQVEEIASLAGSAKMKRSELLPLIKEATGKDGPTDPGVDFRGWLAELTPKEAGAVIAARQLHIPAAATGETAVEELWADEGNQSG